MKFKYLSLALFVISLNCLYGQTTAKEVRIGMFSLEPMNFIDNQGRPSGLYPSLIDEIAKDAGWKVRYIEGTFSEGLERLQNDEIDLMPSIAWSNERSRTMDFTSESITNILGQVFTTADSQILKITDLHGKTVGIMKDDIIGRNLATTVSSLEIQYIPVVYPTHHDVMTAIEEGEVDAGVAPHYFGIHHLKEYDLIETNILFSPFSIYFASKDGQNSDLLNDIDTLIGEWKKEKDSVYYQTVRFWMAPEELRQERIPLWMKGLLATTLSLILLILYFNNLFRRLIKKRTQIIKEKESRYRSLVQQLKSIILRISSDGTILFCNDFGLSLLGLRKYEVLQKNIFDLKLLPPGLTLNNLMNTDTLAQTELINEITTGENSFHIQWSFDRISGGEGKPKEMICLGVDLTGGIRMENALKESEEKFISFMNNIPAGTYIKDPLGTYIYANTTALSMLNKGKEILKIEDFIKTPELLEMIREADQRLLTGQSFSEDFEYEIELLSSHSCTLIRLTHFPILLSNGKRLIGGIAFDISEARTKEEQLNQSRKMQAIGELAGGIAHDFNNQLSGIMGYADLLTQSITDPRLERYAKKLHDGIERASEVTKQLLSFSRKGKKEITNVHMNDLILELIDLLSHTLEKQVFISFTDMAEDSTIQGDPNLIQNALLNIALNARDAMHGKGSLYISTQKIMADDKMVALQGYSIEKGPYLVVSIEDTGEGMTKEVRDKIFEPFFTTKEEEQGTGMGLAMVYGTLKDHHGNVTVQTTVGKGTVFKLYFPCEIPLPYNDGVKGTKQEKIVPSSLRIAIVDDEQMIRDFLSQSLLEAGHRVALFEGGKQIIHAFKETQSSFDLIILDMIMPGMGGLETYQKLTEIQPDLPILLSSGYSPKNELHEILKNDHIVYLQKPYSLKDMNDAISRLMNQ
ncbi:response regulator [Oceanispirochaeta crateris]|nr:transporter substrate-binding domain-containing protein [Oceanispirochaeta crateris]